jgi:hypothetical protein
MGTAKKGGSKNDLFPLTKPSSKNQASFHRQTNKKDTQDTVATIAEKVCELEFFSSSGICSILSLHSCLSTKTKPEGENEESKTSLPLPQVISF